MHQKAPLLSGESTKNVVGLQHILLFERAWTLVGYETFMEKLVTDLPFVEKLLDTITEYNVRLAYRFVQLGVDAVRTGDDYGCQLGLQMNPTLWKRLFKPRLEKIWRVYRENGVVVMHHSCGDVRLVIEDMLDIGLQVLHPVQPHAMSLEELSQKFWNRLVFHGGIDTQQLLPFGTPREVREAVYRCIETLGRYKKYIIAPSQEIMNEVPTENIIALVEAIKEYRGVNRG
ncbi:MAG: uroporphyrinogen decarboxylase family protein [Atribacterota bacterium]